MTTHRSSPDRPVGAADGAVGGWARRFPLGNPGRRLRPAVHHGVEQQRARQGRGRLELRHVDVLAFARAAAVQHAGQDGHRPQVAAHVVEVGERPTGRGPVGQADHEGEAGQGLGRRAHGHVGDVGARVAEPAHRHVDDVGPDVAHDVVAESPARHGPGREALGHHVGPGHQVLQHGQARRDGGRRR